MGGGEVGGARRGRCVAVAPSAPTGKVGGGTT